MCQLDQCSVPNLKTLVFCPKLDMLPSYSPLSDVSFIFNPSPPLGHQRMGSELC